jgi:hypothetical protein
MESNVMIIDFTARALNYSAQGTLRPADDSYADRSADIGVKKTVIRAGIDDGVESFALGVIVDDLNSENGPPDALLLWDGRICVRE